MPGTVVGTRKPKQQWLKPENIHNKNKSRGLRGSSTMTSGIQVFSLSFHFLLLFSNFPLFLLPCGFKRPCFSSMPHVLTIPFPKQEGWGWWDRSSLVSPYLSKFIKISILKFPGRLPSDWCWRVELSVTWNSPIICAAQHGIHQPRMGSEHLNYH